MDKGQTVFSFVLGIVSFAFLGSVLLILTLLPMNLVMWNIQIMMFLDMVSE
jgi:hypothetical protein